ncbi:MAG TPA: HAD domain-containing protein [Rubrivivax sp.]|nr:HAD domain-containing protein [Rubrivivax sp.]
MRAICFALAHCQQARERGARVPWSISSRGERTPSHLFGYRLLQAEVERLIGRHQPLHVETRRLLFLDFDGVLHPTSGGDASLFCRADPLLEALEGADCAIVISSSWRHHHDMSSLLSRLPQRLAARVIGETGEAHVGRWPRYNEIIAFVRGHAPAVNWRALDDSRLEFPPKCRELIACDPNFGFGASECRALKRWLACSTSQDGQD